MERLWRPWRSEYVTKPPAPDEACLFCEAQRAGDDERAGILHRGETCFVMLNAYPYNTGHLMVAPYRHVAEAGDLEPAERHELADMWARAVDVIRAAMSPDGFNVGVNLGRVAGAGVPGHLHVHVVPRWTGDTNFMPVVGEAKVLPEALEDTAAKLRAGFAAAG